MKWYEASRRMANGEFCCCESGSYKIDSKDKLLRFNKYDKRWESRGLTSAMQEQEWEVCDDPSMKYVRFDEAIKAVYSGHSITSKNSGRSFWIGLNGCLTSENNKMSSGPVGIINAWGFYDREINDLWIVVEDPKDDC